MFGMLSTMPSKRPDPDSFVPRYLQIRDEILRRIDTGALATGDQIPSLREMCQEFSVSSITARRALLDLLNEGVVEKRGGLGVFVTGNRRHARIYVLLIGYSERMWRTRSGHFGQLVGGIASAAWEHEATLTVVPAYETHKAATVFEQLLADSPIDGLLVRSAEELDPALLEKARRERVPTVLIKRTSSDGSVSSVMPDACHAGQLAVDLLVRAGHRRIALVAATSSIDTYREHRRGFEEAMLAAGLHIHPDYMLGVGPAFSENGKTGATELMQLADPPTAIVTNSDFIAVGVYDAAVELGLSIPGDLSVVSFDDVEFAEHLSPPLTTVRLSYYDLGRVAAERLFATIENEAGTLSSIVPVQLIERSSVGPPGA